MHRQELTFVPGVAFESRYEILDKIGEGGFGSILRARQLTTNQEVAVKVMHHAEREPDAAPGRRDTRTARFLREARLCAKLHHPNIVPIIDSGQTEGGHLYTVFAFVPGNNLAAVLVREGALAPQEARHLMLQVLDALACAHAQGIVHRDLKPSNVMVIATGARRNALVLDFGIGALIEMPTGEQLMRLTTANDALGTPGYVAPEQWRGVDPSPRADLFSWGLVFLECLTGARVYGGSSIGEVLYKFLGPDPVPMPPALERHPLGALLRRATNKDVAEREASARALFELLDACDVRGLSRRAMGAFHGAPPETGAEHSPPRSSTATNVDPFAVGSHSLSSERRQVTMLCCRLSGHAAKPQTLEVDAEDDLLRVGLAICEAVARCHHGYSVSALGDSLVISFGYPQADEGDATRAARAALAICEAVQAKNERSAMEGVRIEVSIGIHTDLVVIDERGTADEVRRVAHAGFAFGVSSRVALRLASTAMPGTIAVTSESEQLLREAFELEPAAPCLVDPAAAPIKAFWLRRQRNVGGAKVAGGSRLPLIGRHHELKLLLERWNQAREGAGHCCLITGEPGIGKSRLARALRDQLGPDAYLFLESRCSPDTQNTALFPIIEMLRRALELDSSVGPSIQTAHLEALLAARGFTLSDTMPLLAPLFSLPLSTPYSALDGALWSRKELTRNALCALLLAMGDEQPVFLLIEDLHWADPSTIDLLAELVRRVPSSPAFVVMTARPQISPPFASAGMLQLHLGRLERQQIDEMVAELTSLKGLPAQVMEQIARRTDGVPLFVEELTRMMLEAGLLLERAGRDEPSWQLSDVVVPSTLRALLMGRLDRLARAKATAQIAAAIGREFDGELLRAVSPLDEASLREDLDKLALGEIVYTRRLNRRPTYVFKHALIRDAAYESMPKRTRQHVHGLIARALEERLPHIAAERPELLAYHHAAADRKLAAVGYAYQAGLAALRLSAHPEAQRAFGQLLEWLAELPDIADSSEWEYKAQLQLANLAKVRSGWQSEEAKEAYVRAHVAARQIGDARLLSPVLVGLWGYYLGVGDISASYEMARQLLEIGDRTDDPECRLAANASVANSLFWIGDLAGSRRYVDAALAIYEAHRSGEQTVSYGLDQFALVQIFGVLTHILMGRPAAARDELTKSLRYARQLGHPFSLVLLLQVNAWERYHERDPAGTLEAAEELVEISLKHGFPQYTGVGIMFRGWARSIAGADGVADIERGFAQWAGTSNGFGATLKAMMVGEVYARAGQFDALVRLIDEALDIVETRQERIYLPELLRLKAQWLVASGEHAPARDVLRRAHTSARLSSAHWFELRAAVSLVNASREAPHEELVEARQLLEGVLQRFDPTEDIPDLREARQALTRSYATGGA